MWFIPRSEVDAKFIVASRRMVPKMIRALNAARKTLAHINNQASHAMEFWDAIADMEQDTSDVRPDEVRELLAEGSAAGKQLRKELRSCLSYPTKMKHK